MPTAGPATRRQRRDGHLRELGHPECTGGGRKPPTEAEAEPDADDGADDAEAEALDDRGPAHLPSGGADGPEQCENAGAGGHEHIEGVRDDQCGDSGGEQSEGEADGVQHVRRIGHRLELFVHDLVDGLDGERIRGSCLGDDRVDRLGEVTAIGSVRGHDAHGIGGQFARHGLQAGIGEVEGRRRGGRSRHDAGDGVGPVVRTAAAGAVDGLHGQLIADAETEGLRIGFVEHELVIGLGGRAGDRLVLVLRDVRGHGRDRGAVGGDRDESGFGQLGALGTVELGDGLRQRFVQG
jgi:hypothetical protein